MNQNKIRNTFVLSVLLGLMATTVTHDRAIANDSPERPAYSVYADLQESATSFNARALMVGDNLAIEGMDAGVTYGAEKKPHQV